MTKRLVTLGDLVVDLLLDVDLPVQPARHQTARALRFEAGGACTTILAARELGMNVAALGTVGDDLPGRFLLDTLRGANVDTTALLIPPGSTSTTVVALSDRALGEHVFLGHYGSSEPIPLTEAAAQILDQADAVFIPGYSLLESRLAGLVAGVFERLADSGARIYFDVGPFAVALPKAQVERVLGAADTLLLTEDEIPFVAAGARGIPACRRLLDANPQLTVVVKLAEAGCHILSRGLDAPCPGFTVDVVDTIGAGDAFAAAYIWADLQGYSAAECGTIGNAMGAASVMRDGAGSNVPKLADLQRILSDNRTGISLKC